MRKRVAGAAILVAVGIGIWLSNLFNGLGPGGAGTNIGMNPDTQVSLDGATISGGTGDAGTGSHEGRATAPAIPTVVIDEREFYLEQSGGGETMLIPTDAAQEDRLIPTDVEHITVLVRKTKPNDDGIRVQIKRRRSSRPSAETALNNALHQAGITEEQILRHGGFAD